MKGDFSRGHGPDARRGRRYQRVLLQQGRLLLDSDFNAFSDATESRLREMARDLGGREGSPDGGFLITSGPPLAVFESPGALLRLEASAAPFAVRLDHRQRFRGRFPSLCVDATAGQGQVKLRLRRPLAGSGLSAVRLWVCNAAGLRVGVGGGALRALQAPTAEGFQPYDVPLPSVLLEDTLVLDFEHGGSQAWVGLVEGVEGAGAVGRFWVSGGRYLLGGLAVELGADGPWPEVSFPAALGFNPGSLAAGHYVAFLEAWERHVGAVEDGGLRETALGGTQDTTTRVAVMGQVKLAPVSVPPRGAREVEVLREALRAVPPSSGLLRLESGVYTGSEHRLYRFEVHTGGVLGQVSIKWSRHNGAELYPVLQVSPWYKSQLLLPSTADVRNGDLVEVLSDAVDLGDERAGRMEGASTFTPPERQVGPLYYVRELRTDEVGRWFELRAREGLGEAPLDDALARQPGLKVRRWQGLVDTKDGPSSPLEDGLKVVLEGGTFRAGDYWQYEARRGAQVEPGKWQVKPQGPERLFAPLALLKVGPSGPAEVLEWLVSPPRLSADRVSFDGGGAGSDARTVQEALEELYAWQRSGDAVLFEPSGMAGADDGERLRQLVRERLPRGGLVLMASGVFHLRTTVEVADLRLELKGRRGTVVMGEVPRGPALRVGSRGRLALEELVLAAGAGSGPVLVELAPGAEELSAHACTLVHAQGGSSGRLLSALAGEPVLPERQKVRELTWEGFAPTGPVVRLSDCVAVAGWGVTLGEVRGLSLSDSVLLCSRGGVVAGDVALLELERVRLDTGLEESQLLSLSAQAPKGLEAAVERVVESLAPRKRSSGVAFYAERVGRGLVESCLLSADMGLWVALAAGLRLERNRHLAGDTAVRMDGAAETGLEAEEVSAGNLGVHVPATATGLSLEGCRVQARFGAMLGGPYVSAVDGAIGPLPGLVSLRDVRVASCSMEGSLAALHVGVTEYDESQPPAMELWNVELASNLLRGTTPAAVALSLVVHYPGGTLPAVRVHDNQLEGAQEKALWSVGGGLELSRNRIYAEGKADGAGEPTPGSLSSAAVLVMAGGALRIEDNQVELGGSGLCLGVSGCQDVRLARNVFQGGRGYQSLALWDAHQVEVAENDFRDGSCMVFEGEGLTLRANRLGGGLSVTGTGSGQIAHNRMDEYEGTALSLSQVFGRWQVVGNTVAGGLRVLPRVYSELTEGLEGLAADLPRPGGSEPLRVPWLPGPVNAAAWVRETVAEARQAVGELLVTSPGLAASLEPLVEDEVRLLVQGNRAGELVVGHVHPMSSGKPGLEDLPVAEPYSFSVVQVLGNHAEGRLVVNGYSRCIAAHNVAGRLLMGGEVPERLLDSNLSLE